jgi:hypothetical protein
MKRFFVAARLDLETFPPAGDLLPVPQILNHFRSEKDEVIAQGRNQSQPVGI